MRRMLVCLLAYLAVAPATAQRSVISTNPETPFKLATFLADGKTRVGLVLGTRILDIEAAHTAVIQELGLRGLPAMPVVTIEIEGIGTLRTAMRAAAAGTR